MKRGRSKINFFRVFAFWDVTVLHSSSDKAENRESCQCERMKGQSRTVSPYVHRRKIHQKLS